MSFSSYYVILSFWRTEGPIADSTWQLVALVRMATFRWESMDPIVF